MTEMIPKENRLKALAIGTLTGFAGVGLVDFLHAIFSMSGSDYTGLGFILVIGFYYILIGLPLAFILCFTVGIPIYLIINKLSDMTLRAAMIMGGLMGLIFGSVNFALFVQAWPFWLSSLDWISTICVGAFAGYISFSRTKRDIINFSEFD
jgi:hypothetical protein